MLAWLCLSTNVLLQNLHDRVVQNAGGACWLLMHGSACVRDSLQAGDAPGVPHERLLSSQLYTSDRDAGGTCRLAVAWQRLHAQVFLAEAGTVVPPQHFLA